MEKEVTSQMARVGVPALPYGCDSVSQIIDTFLLYKETQKGQV